MKEEDIIKNNAIIAEFMGFTEKLSSVRFKKPSKPGYGKLSDIIFINGHNNPNGDDPCFHSSWDWLFPVLSKINKIKNELYEDYYKGTKLAIKFNYNTSLAECIMNLEDISVLDADIKECHKLATKFAKWYNKQKK